MALAGVPCALAMISRELSGVSAWCYCYYMDTIGYLHCFNANILLHIYKLKLINIHQS